MNRRYKFSDTEIKKLLKENLVIIYDTREQQNLHITDYFDSKKIKYKEQTVDEGDYTAIITARPDMGITRDLYFNVAIERKNSVDELIGSIKQADRFENEFDRAKAKGIRIFLMVEEKDGLENMRNGAYRSEYTPKALVGKFKSLEDKYLAGTTFETKRAMGFEIYHKLYYSIRNILKNGEVDLDEAWLEEY